MLTSSSVRPCLDSEIIGKGTGESPAFRKLFPRVVEQFGGHFQAVTADAGLTCSENATLVTGVQKHYLFTLGENLHRLYELVSSKLKSSPLKAHCTEFRDGARIRRELYTLTVSEVGGPAPAMLLLRQIKGHD